MTVRGELALVLILAVIARLPWLLMVPVAEAPDEATHAWVIHFCAEHLRLPVLTDVRSGGPIAVYGPIPQFGYLPHIVLIRSLPVLAELITMRLGSLVMALVTITVAYFIGRHMFLPKRLLALALPGLLIFHPQYVLVGSYANNDITACALASLIVFLLIKTLEKGPSFVVSITIGGLLGWLTLSKYSGCALVPVAFIFLSVAAWINRATVRSCLLNLMLMLAPFVTLVGAWCYRNYYAFEGDITGTRTLHYIWTSTYHRKFDSYRSPLEIVVQSRWWRMNFFSFWGWFGYMTRSLPRPFYYGYLLFVIAAFWGGLSTLKPTLLIWKGWLVEAERKQLVKPCVWLLFVFLSLSNLFTSLAASSSGIAGPQGRYLFISEIPLMALLIAGLSKLSGRLSRAMIWGLLAFNLATYLYSSGYLYSIYCLNTH
jgi:4-amino-4-deoxy-L-arabinose transferase-like glycosyltransferase